MKQDLIDELRKRGDIPCSVSDEEIAKAFKGLLSAALIDLNTAIAKLGNAIRREIEGVFKK